MSREDNQVILRKRIWKSPVVQCREANRRKGHR